MSREKIPSKIVVTCDVCRREVGGTGPSYRQEIRLVFEQHALDFHGMAVGNGTVSFDLCDECGNQVRKAVNSEMAKLAPKGWGDE